MRSLKSLKNMLLSVISNCLTIVIAFFVQGVFIRKLGSEYLGINTLFTNIASILAILDFGISTAVIYNLYKPIANHDEEKIGTIMNFFRKSYIIIFFVIFLVGLCVIPFLDLLVGEVSSSIHVVSIYLLFVIDASFAYIFSYKRSLLYADQNNYIISLIHIFYLIIMNSLLITVLFTNKNYHLYLGIKILMRFIENAVISLVVNKKYSYLKKYRHTTLDQETKFDIFKKMKGLFYHKVGTTVVNSSSSIVISTFLGGVKTVAYYSNYNMVTSAVSTMITQGFSAITSSVGNLMVSSNQKSRFSVYKRLNFLNFWIAGFTATCIYVVMDSYIIVLAGSDYLLSHTILFAIVLNFYFTVLLSTLTSFKEAAGIFHEDRFVPFLQSFVSIVFSIVLSQFMGLAGVFVGSMLGTFVLYFFSYPKFVYLKLFNSNYHEYIKSFVKYFLIFLVGLFLTYQVSTLFVISNNILQMLFNAFLCVIVVNVIYFIIFFKSDELKYFVLFFKKIKGKMFGRKRQNN